MTDDVEGLSAALDGDQAGGSAPGSVLLDLATELRHALAARPLPHDTRVRLLSRALQAAPRPGAQVGPSRPASPMGLRHRLRLPRVGRTSAVIGGTAVVALAAIGIGVAHRRRTHGAAAA